MEDGEKRGGRSRFYMQRCRGSYIDSIIKGMMIVEEVMFFGNKPKVEMPLAHLWPELHLIKKIILIKYSIRGHILVG